MVCIARKPSPVPRRYRGALGWYCNFLCPDVRVCRKKETCRCVQGTLATCYVRCSLYPPSMMLFTETERWLDRSSVSFMKIGDGRYPRFFLFWETWEIWRLMYVILLRSVHDLIISQADFHAKYNGEKSDAMEDAARTIGKAFSNCLTDRYCSSFPVRGVIEVPPHIGCLRRTSRENGAFIML